MQGYKSRKIIARRAARQTRRKYSGGGKSFDELFRTADRLIRESKVGVETKPLVLALNELVRTPQFMAFCAENAVYPGPTGDLKKLNSSKFQTIINTNITILRNILTTHWLQFKSWLDKNSERNFKMDSPHTTPTKSVIFDQDPIMAAMMKGELLWGDLLYTSPKSKSPKSKSPKSKTPKSKSPSSNYVPINDVFENYETPHLSDKRFIWENFPVVLERISTTNGTEKYAIKWHLKNLKEWRDTRTKSFEEAMEYQLFSELRLIHSLRKHPHLYVLHEPRTKDEIVVVEMIGAAKAHVNNTVEAPRTKVAKKESEIPVLRKLNDITTYFPGVVVWGKVDGRKGESTYALTIRGDFMKKMDRKLADRILHDLEIALRASRFWTVLPPARGEYLRIEMQHE